jgi:hypothetical protein
VDRKSKVTVVILAIAFALLLTLFWLLTFAWKIDAERLSAFFAGFLALATLLAAVAVIAAFAQVREAKKALRDSRTWNQMNAAMTFMPPAELLHRWEIELENSFVRLISRDDAIDKDDVRRLYEKENTNLRILLRAYLNVLEAYSIAVNCGIADLETAKRIWGYKMVRHFTELRPYIDRARELANDKSLFGELGALCEAWHEEWPMPKGRYPVEP